MADETLLRTEVPDVVVELLDHSAGRPLKTWKFPARPRISIGRDPSQDVEISDPFVSRAHAELEWREDEWVLVSRGRHGVLVENRLITEYPVPSEVTFRLGSGGPTLRFAASAPVDAGSQTFEVQKDFALERNARTLLDGVETALAKLEKGTYGLCERCGKPIPEERLEAIPQATLCVPCKSEVERTTARVA